MKNYAAIGRRLRMFVLSLLIVSTMLFAVWAEVREEAAPPVFSAESGFYRDAFYLELTAPKGCSIYYTLDSSIPDTNSIRYTGPVYIDDASLHENTYSMIEGMSVREDIAHIPDFLIDKCTVVRAIAIPDFDLSQKNSEVITKSYFVGHKIDDFDSCGIISLVTDPDNLFDSTQGIYVAGDVYQKYLATTPDPFAKTWAKQPANYRQRGRQWEREANITFWDSDGNLILTKDIGIRTQGGWSRSYVPRSLSLFAREEYDGSDSFEYDFFDTSQHLSTLTLSVGGNRRITRINDYLMSERIQNPPYGMMSFRPYVMFLDGEYWGFYWLTERYDAKYIQQMYDLDTSEIIIIKNTNIDEGTEEYSSLYKSMVNYFANHNMADENNYRQACELIDIESFLDYYATMVYIGRSGDWPNGNEALWRTKDISHQPFADGKWRWLMFDCNSPCMDENLTEHNTLEWVQQKSTLFRSLWESPLFRESFETRIMEISDQYFDGEEICQFVEEYKRTMTAPLQKTWARFFLLENDKQDVFEHDLKRLQNFFLKRRAVVASWFE